MEKERDRQGVRMYLAFGITLLKLLQPCHCVYRLGAAKRISLTSTQKTIRFIFEFQWPYGFSKMLEAELVCLEFALELSNASGLSPPT